jgi:hypothetical protein
MTSSDEIPHFCAQKFLPIELVEEAIQKALKENPENIIHSPDLTLPPAGGVAPAMGVGPSGEGGPIVLHGGSSRIGLFVRKMWANGRTLRVRFLSGGSSFIRAKVQQYANVWSSYANLHFQFVDSGPAEIRITFATGGSWSYIGTDALAQPTNSATMNYGWFSDKTDDEEFSRTVIHEFGHAIGCIHEHSQPNSKIQWNKPVVYASYKEQGWTPADVDSNVFYHYTSTDVSATKFDAISIMEYPIPKNFTTNGFTTGWNKHLSSSDIAFIGRMYPKRVAQPITGSTAGKLEIGVYNSMSDASPNASTAQSHRTIVSFSKPYPAPPAFIVGLNFLDFDNSRNLRIRSLVEAVLPGQAVVKLQSWADTIQHASGVSWLLSPKDDADFQHGSFTAKESPAQKTISFNRAYSSPPQVLVFFTALDIDKSSNLRIKTYASEVTNHGFKLNVETWSNTHLSEVGVSWIAIPEGKQGVASGTFSTEDVRSSNTSQPNTQNTVVFSPKFSNPPKIFLALNMLNFDRGAQTRVRLSASSVRGDQMEWHIDSWGDTKLFAAGATYVAINGSQ